MTFAILLGSALSFLGLGPQPPSSEWGLMIAESRQFLDQAPWIGLAPGLCLCVLLVAVNLVGEGLRERLDPRLQAAAMAERRCLERRRGLSVGYPHRRAAGCTRCDDVSLAIAPRQALGLVGESGSGKSTVVLALLGLLGDAARVAARRIGFDGARPAARAPPRCAGGASASCSRTRPPPSTRR